MEKPDSILLKDILQELEREHIIRILESNRWRRLKTAKDLGITAKTLRIKIKEYGIQ